MMKWSRETPRRLRGLAQGRVREVVVGGPPFPERAAPSSIIQKKPNISHSIKSRK